MFRWSAARTWRASVLTCTLGGALALTLACSGDEILGPIDTAACTRGALDVTTSTQSAVNGADCELWSEWQFEPVPAETWTLRLEPHTGYVIRLISHEQTPGVFPFRGELLAYERDANGERQLVAASEAYGPGNRNEELVMTTDRARVIALRVEARQRSDTGVYRLEVSTCPVHHVPLDSTVRGVSSNTGCLSEGTFAGARSRLTFFDFDIRRLDDLFIAYERRAGSGTNTGTLRARLSGPDLDVAASFSGSFLAASPATANVFDFNASAQRIGRYTLSVRVHADSSATIDATRDRSTLLRASSSR